MRENAAMRNKKGWMLLPVAALGLLVTLVMPLAGCGGITSLLWKLAGVFAAEYAREAAQGYLTVAVDRSGAASVVLVDPVLGVLQGTGQVTSSGRLQAVLSDPESQVSVTVDAQLGTRGSTVILSGSLDGSIQSGNLSGNKLAEPTENPFAGNWSGEYVGTATGTWTAVVGQDGTLTITVQTASGPLTLAGTVSNAGAVSAETTTPDGKVEWEGALYFREGQGAAAGSWRGPGDASGTWAGSRED